MRHHLPLMLIAIGGCSKVQNSFEIYTGEKSAVSARLSLCDEDIQLFPAGERFRAAAPIKCEDVGTIRVRYADGSTVDCRVGPVRPEAYRHWRVRVAGGLCEPLPD